MAKETIESIRQAELAAQKAEEEAAASAEQIVAGARKEAKELVASMTREAREKERRALETADAQSDAEMSEALHQAEGEVIKLRELVAAKDAQTVSMILSELI